MHRRSFLTVSGASVAAVATGAAGHTANAQAPAILGRCLELSAAIAGPSGHLPGLTATWAQFAHHVSVLTQGRLALRDAGVEAADSGPLGPVAGEHDIAIGSDILSVHHHPGFAYFGGMPDGVALPPSAHRVWLDQGPGQELWDELAADFGLKSLAIAAHGADGLALMRAGPPGDAALAGKRIATAGLGERIVARLGGTPLPFRSKHRDGMSMTEMLGSAACDGVDLIDRASFEQARLDCASLTLAPPVAAASVMIGVGMRLSTWNRLESGMRSALVAAARLTWDETSPPPGRPQHVPDPVGRDAGAADDDGGHAALARAIHTAGRDVAEEIGATDGLTRRISASYRHALERSGRSAGPTA